ncbi:hypothetical protein XENOCAPTIV_013524, partial [Xenoophorus captivus]
PSHRLRSETGKDKNLLFITHPGWPHVVLAAHLFPTIITDIVVFIFSFSAVASTISQTGSTRTGMISQKTTAFPSVAAKLLAAQGLLPIPKISTKK